MLRKNIDHTI